jgi:hypothetical protein
LSNKGLRLTRAGPRRPIRLILFIHKYFFRQH